MLVLEVIDKTTNKVKNVYEYTREIRCINMLLNMLMIDDVGNERNTAYKIYVRKGKVKNNEIKNYKQNI